MPGKRILSDQQLDKLFELRGRGWGSQRIVEYFASEGTTVSVGVVEWQCLKAGADRPKKFWGKPNRPGAPYVRKGYTVRPFAPEDDELLRQLDMEGIRISDISRRLGRAPNSVRGRLYTLARRDERAEAAAA